MLRLKLNHVDIGGAPAAILDGRKISQNFKYPSVHKRGPYLVVTVSSDGLEPTGAWSSAGTVLTRNLGIFSATFPGLLMTEKISFQQMTSLKMAVKSYSTSRLYIEAELYIAPLKFRNG